MSRQMSVFSGAFQRHSDVVAESMRHILPSVERAAKLIQQTVQRDRLILICGNGGSAADSQHLATEFVARYKKERKALRALALTTDASALTAIGNDYSFEDIFKRQIEAVGRAGDLLIAFTTSGGSLNIRRALKAARARDMNIILLTGKNGASLARSAEAGIVVPSTETARIQEIHQLVYHAWCEYIDAIFSA